MLLTILLESGSFENGEKENWRNLYIVVVVLSGFMDF